MKNEDFSLRQILEETNNSLFLNESLENEDDYDENDEDLEWSQTSWDRHPDETDDDYDERMEDLDNMLDGWL